MEGTAALPLYVEVSPLLTIHLTGIGRLVARLVEALGQRRPLRLVSTVSGAHARNMNLSLDLTTGEEVAVEPGTLPAADDDVGAWARKLLKQPKRPHDAALAARCPGLYTLLRPRDRHFAREIGVLYDFTPALVPWAHVPETREHFGIFFGETSGLCDKVVAISRSTRDDARWLSAATPEDVAVGYPGPSLCTGRHASLRPVERRRNVLLVVSTQEPRKNGGLLLDWFLGTDALDPDAELWWVGPRGWFDNPFGRLCRPRRRRVRFLGVVPDRGLCELYRTAACVVYPSLYEGFGFPVLDALRHGAPVLCGFNSSLQEFEGPGVHYFDACDPDALDAAWRSAQWADPPHRDDLDDRFSWDGMARTVLQLCAA